MDMVRLGRSELNVSVACLGTGGYSRLGQTSGATAAASVGVVRSALSLGVNFIDTAAAYGTEEIVGAAIKGHRDEVVVATKNIILKAGAPIDSSEFITGAEYKELVEGNLRRLGTDYIDVLHAHGIQSHQYDYCVSEIMPSMMTLRDEGKVRFLGISETFNADTTHDMLTRAVEDSYFDVIMLGLNLINQTALRHVLPAAEAKDIGIQSIYAIRRRLATLVSASELVADLVASGEVDPADVDAVDPLGFLFADSDVSSLPDACYRFNRHAQGVHTVLTGTGSLEHLKQNLVSINSGPLPGTILDRLTEMFGRVESVSGG